MSKPDCNVNVNEDVQGGMTETLPERLRAAADVYSEHPPIFGLFFEAADALDHVMGSLRACIRMLAKNERGEKA